MARPSTTVPIAGEILKGLISERRLQVDQFGDKLGVSKETVYSWIRDNRIPPRRLVDAGKALSLSSSDLQKLTDVPQRRLVVQFRTLRDRPVSEGVKRDVEEVAREFFRLDNTSIERKVVRRHLLDSDDPESMAEMILGVLQLDRSKLSVETVIRALEALNIHVAFYDFGPEFVGVKAQAACAVQGEKSIIFINSHEATEDILWRIFHEACHLFANHEEITPEQEQFCNKVASEATTPSSFFERHREALKKEFAKGKAKSPYVTKELARLLSAGFGGVIIALKDNKVIDDDTAKYLWGCFHRTKNSRPTVRSKITPGPSEDGGHFWQRVLNDPEKTKFLKFQRLVQQALIEERISVSRAAEILQTDDKTAEELGTVWRRDLEAAQEMQE